MRNPLRFYSLVLAGAMLWGGECLADAATQKKDARPVASDIIIRNPGEPDTEFVSRNPPSIRPLLLKMGPDDPDTIRYGAPDLVHGPITTKWNGASVIIAFYEDSVTRVTVTKTNVLHYRETHIRGYVFTPTGEADRYKRLSLKAIEPDGGEPAIEAVFFANADRDAAKELAVLVSFPQQGHREYSGDFYSVFFYDDLSAISRDSLAYLPEVTNKVGVSSRAEWGDGKHVGTYSYSTASEVKKVLKKLGY